jgi:two-component system, sensor histidine kinase and response regulator
MEELKVLMLEDNENDVEIIQNEILSMTKYKYIFKWVSSKTDYENALDEFQPDIILSDYSLPQLTGFQALNIALEKKPLIPFIIVTGSLLEETAANSILRGAWDYVVKERLHRLSKAMENALKLRNEKEKLAKKEEELKIIKMQAGIQIKLLFDAINHAPSSVVITDDQSNILFVNPKFTEVTGYTSAEVIGNNTRIFKSGKHDAEFYKKLWETLLKGDEWKGELINKKKNGELFWERVSISPIKDENNQIVHFVAIKHDITDIKENEQKLQSSENWYKALFRNTGTATCIIDGEGIIILANPKAEELSGYSKDEIVGKKKWSEFVAQDDLERMMKYFYERKTNTGNLPNTYEYKMIDKNAFLKDILLAVDVIEGTEITIASLIDITERKKIESELEAERILLRTVIDNLPDAIYVKDEKLRKVLLNKADLKNIGKEENEVIGKNDYELFLPEIAVRTCKDDEYVINTGKPIINKEEFLVNYFGKEIWMLTSKLPLRNKDGKITGLVGIGHDITENKKMVEELIRAKERAEEMDRLKSIFLSNMSHELRTPLVGLLGFSDIITAEATGEMKEYAEMISTSGERLLRTLSTILDYSRIEAGKVEVFRKNILLVDLLNDEIRLYLVLAKNKGITINTDYSDEQLLISTDERLLREIIDNLINNAIKFSKDGKITIKFYKEKETAVIKIIDTGVGIPSEKFEQIFEEFRQVSEGDNRIFQGTGLGLTLVKKYLVLLNGRIEVESKVGVGSTFTVYLPDSQIRSNKVPKKEKMKRN